MSVWCYSLPWKLQQYKAFGFGIWRKDPEKTEFTEGILSNWGWQVCKSKRSLRNIDLMQAEKWPNISCCRYTVVQLKNTEGKQNNITDIQSGLPKKPSFIVNLRLNISRFQNTGIYVHKYQNYNLQSNSHQKNNHSKLATDSYRALYIRPLLISSLWCDKGSICLNTWLTSIFTSFSFWQYKVS